jgi:hypothetical protein
MNNSNKVRIITHSQEVEHNNNKTLEKVSFKMK